MSKRKDLTPTRKVKLTFKESTQSDQMGDVFNISPPTSESDPKNVVQQGSIKPGSTWFNKVQSNQVQSNQVQSNQVQRGSEPGSTTPGKPISLGQLFVLSVIADKETAPYEPITLKKSDIARATDLTLDGVKTAIRRLFEKGALEFIAHKDGRKFGGTTYKLTMTAREILSSKAVRNLTRFNVVQHGSEPGSTGDTSSSSKILDLKTTNYWETANRENFSDSTPTDPAWTQIDLDPLTDIGFNQAHVAQVQKQALHTPKSLQDSIYAFKFDLNTNSIASKIDGSPLNFFMGILRKGPYSPPPNYESPEDRQLREYLEAKEKLLENRRQKLNRLKDLEFEDWLDSLPTVDIEKLAPMGTTDVLKRSQLRNHFDAFIWEKKKKEIVKKLRGIRNGEASRDPMLIPEKNSYTQNTIPPLNPP